MVQDHLLFRLEWTKVMISNQGFVLVKENICSSICCYVVSFYPMVNHIHYNEFQAVTNVDELVDI